MKKLLALALLLASPAQAAITFVCEEANHADTSGATDGAAAVIDVSECSGGTITTGDLMVVGLGAASTSTMSVIEAGGQSWTVLPSSGSGQQRFAYAEFNGTWSADPSFRPSTPSGGQLTAWMTVYRKTSGSYTWEVDAARQASTFSAPGSPFDVTATGQATTSGASIVTIAFWRSTDDNTWSIQTANWNAPNSQAQYRNGTSFSVATAYRIQSSATSSTGNVVNRQATNGGDGGAWQIITFREVLTNPTDCAALSAFDACTTFASVASESVVGSEINAAISPDIVSGDSVGYDAVTAINGWPITWQTDGRLNIGCDGSDCPDGTRDYFEAGFYDASASGLHASNPLTIWVGDFKPYCEYLESPIELPYKISAGTKLDFSVFCRHRLDTDNDGVPDTDSGDALTYTLQSGTEPDGLSIGSLSGELDEDGSSDEAEGGVALTYRVASAVTGSYTDVPLVVYPLDTVTVPDCSGESLNDCVEATADSWLEATAIFRCRTGVEIGTVIGQSPASGQEAEPFSTVTYVASNGPCTRQFPVNQ